MKTMLAIALFSLVFPLRAQVDDFSNIDFTKADRIAHKYKEESLKNLPTLAYNLTYQLPTEVERFRAIYRWVCNNIANDYRLYEKNMHKRRRFKDDSLKLKSWNEKFRKLSLRTMIEDKRAICTGYAYLLQEMSQLAGIQCEVVHGYARTSTINVETLTMPNHSWNAVQLNGKWYLCDPTWASGTPSAKNFRFEFNYNDGFFLTNPKLFAINHYPEDPRWLLIDENPPKYEDFLDAPVFYGKAYENLKSYSAPSKMHNTVKKNERVTFKCQLQRVINTNDVILLVDNGNDTRKVHPENITIKNEDLIIEYAFERTGFYDVHFMIGPDLISTYTFRVKG